MKIKKILKALKIGTYTLGGASGAYAITNLVLEKKSSDFAQNSDETPENLIGYEEINILNNDTVRNNNFVIIHVNREMDVYTLKEKIEFCQKNDISVGLVLDTKASTLVDAYYDVDFLQAIVKEYKIDFPIYFNIESIMSNETLNIAQRQEIMDAFIDKMSRSDMYLGLYGKDSVLCECNKYVTDITSYDCFLVKESEKVKFKGSYNLKQELDGTITADYNMSKIILEKELNSANKLVFSINYKVKEGDTYHSLALEYGLSEFDLRKYNNSDNEELQAGEVIAIPNKYQSIDKSTNEVTYNYAIARGIDISSYQTKIDWDRVEKTSDFVIVQVARDKANYKKYNGNYQEECISQIKNTIEHKIELGLYFCISKDMKISVYEERLTKYFEKLETDLEANDIKLERENIPVFLDFEVFYEFNDYYKLMEVFEKVCNKHGFSKIGIYANGSTLESISKSLKKDNKNIDIKDTNWYVWKSGGAQYSRHENTDTVGVTLEKLQEPKNISNTHYTPSILQVTNVCKDTGASNDKGNCDVNYCYSEDLFGTKFSNEDKEQYEELQYVTIDLNQYKGMNAHNIVNSLVSGFMAAGVLIAGIDVIGRKLIIKFRRNILGQEVVIKPKKKEKKKK